MAVVRPQFLEPVTAGSLRQVRDGHRTASPIRVAAVALAAALLLALGFSAVGATVTPAPAEAKKSKKKVNHCKRWGDKRPGQVSRMKIQKATICLVNRQRAQRGLKRLKRTKPLQRAAQRYSRHMRRTQCFSHSCSGAPDMVTRLRRAGYPGSGNSLRFAGENLAWGSSHLGTPRSIVRAWMKSSAHRQIILAKQPRDIGVGVVKGTIGNNGNDGGIYTANFGKRG